MCVCVLLYYLWKVSLQCSYVLAFSFIGCKCGVSPKDGPVVEFYICTFFVLIREMQYTAEELLGMVLNYSRGLAQDFAGQYA